MNTQPPDYYATYASDPRSRKPSRFIANVLATSETHAIRIARDQTAARGRIIARHIGREGYFAALRSSMSRTA